jgi:hypothetical protein
VVLTAVCGPWMHVVARLVMTPKIGKSQGRLGRLVRPGLRGGLTRVSCSKSGTRPVRRSNHSQRRSPRV